MVRGLETPGPNLVYDARPLTQSDLENELQRDLTDTRVSSTADNSKA